MPAGNLTVGRAEPRAGALVIIGETRAGVLGGAETKVGVHKTGDASTCGAGNLDTGGTTLVVLGSAVEPRVGVPANRTGATLGVVASTGDTTAGVPAATGELMAGTPGNLAGGGPGNAGPRGAVVAGLAPLGGATAGGVVVLLLGTGGGAGLEIMRTWLPGPRPWGGTTKRVLLRRICVPAARGVVVFMTILCWTVAVVVGGVAETRLALQVTPTCFTEEAGGCVWVTMEAVWGEGITGAGVVPTPLRKLGD